jgi:3-dehydroquinate synthase
MTTTLTIRSAAGTYPVVIGPGILSEVGSRLRAQTGDPDGGVFIVTDDTVHALGYADVVQQSCTRAGYAATVAVVPPRDESKSLEMANTLYDRMLDAGIRRNGVVLAVGGGVVGDLAGFVAATYLRGIRFAQIPTTLLAHDSSLGGKVGVNLSRGKNLVGAFHPPIAVWYDVQTLASLPEREWRGGMTEVIKHALIGDKTLFAELAATPMDRYPGDDAAERLVARAAAVKIAVVEADERESGQRMWLNVGHTVGHAVEQLSHYQLNHGEAIAMGLCVEAQLALDLGLADTETRDQISFVLVRHGLPTVPPAFDFTEVVRVLNLDKKHRSNEWTFVLPVRIGRVDIVHGVTETALHKAWQQVLTGEENQK